jgi:hypothetical protein
MYHKGSFIYSSSGFLSSETPEGNELYISFVLHFVSLQSDISLHSAGGSPPSFFVRSILAPSGMVYWFPNLITTQRVNTISFPYPGIGSVNFKPCVGRLSNNRAKGQEAYPLTRERKLQHSTHTNCMEHSLPWELNRCSGTKISPAIYGSQGPITVFKRYCDPH